MKIDQWQIGTHISAIAKLIRSLRIDLVLDNWQNEDYSRPGRVNVFKLLPCRGDE